VENPGLDRESLDVLVAEWELRVNEIEVLIASFEEALSPASLFSAKPLCGIDFRPVVSRSFRKLVHILWSRRLDVPRLVSTATERLNDARACGTSLRVSLEFGIDCPERVLSELTTFISGIRLLSEALSAFPRNTEVL
jgi:hypothetical protein